MANWGPVTLARRKISAAWSKAMTASAGFHREACILPTPAMHSASSGESFPYLASARNTVSRSGPMASAYFPSVNSLCVFALIVSKSAEGAAGGEPQPLANTRKKQQEKESQVVQKRTLIYFNILLQPI